MGQFCQVVRAWRHQAEAFDFAAQGVFIDPQFPGRGQAAPAVALQGLSQEALFLLFQAQALGERRQVGFPV